jgi:hypothetical protein
VGFSQHGGVRRTSLPTVTINQWLQYKCGKEAGVYVRVQNQCSEEGIIKTVKITNSLGDDLEAKKVVAAKVSAEGLTHLSTTEIARAYHDVPTPEGKRKTIESPVRSSDTATDILCRSISRIELDKLRIAIDKEDGDKGKNVEEYTQQDFGNAVKEFLDAMQIICKSEHKMVGIVQHGIFSKSDISYGIHRIDELIGVLMTYKEYLKGVE